MGWSKLRAVAHKYGFTESEARAVVLIVSAAVIGAVLGQSGTEGDRRSFADEYRHMDSLFAVQAEKGTEAVLGHQQTVVSDTSPSFSRTASNLIDINTASAVELDELPGIGPVIAQRIVDYRTKYGPFRNLDDLIKVKSIGNKKFQQIEPYICIGE